MSVAIALSTAIGFAHAEVPALIMTEARGLSLEHRLKAELKASATLHKARRTFYRQRAKLSWPIQHGQGDIRIQRPVKQRYLADSSYRPDDRVSYIDNRTWLER